MKKMIFKSIAVTLLVILCINYLLPLAAFASETADEKLVFGNKYVQVSVNKENGRFTIQTVEGSLNRTEDNNKPLLFEENVPDTSFTTFRINGKDYIYGNSYGFLGMGDSFTSNPATTGLTNQSTCVINGVEISQTLMIVNNLEDANAGNVKIRYTVKNKTGNEVKIGTRMLLDTFVGSNDAAPFVLPGRDGSISRETSFEGADMPLYWKAVDDINAPKVVSYGLLGGWKNVMPDQITFAHWQSLSGTKWGYTADSGLDFTGKDNKYGDADSAVAMTWKESTLAAYQEIVYETYYGIGDFSTESSKTNFTVKPFAPEKLTLNAAGNGYTQDEIAIGMQVDNTYTSSAPLKNVTAKLELSYGLKLDDGETSVKTYPTIGINEIKSITFRVKPIPLYKTGVPYYKLTLNVDGVDAPIEKRGSILIPAISGEPPVISFTDFSPKELYNEDDKKNFTILGKGFDLLLGDEQFNITLTNAKTNEKTVIPKSNINVSGNSMIVSIPNSLVTACKKGNYKISVGYSDQGQNKTYDFSSQVNMSDQIQYQVKQYKILQVVRTENNGEFTYSFRESDKDTISQPVDAKTAVMLEFKGNIEKNGSVYTCKDNETLINNLVKFKYTPDDPLIAQKYITVSKKVKDATHQEDYISVEGSGTMYLANFPFSLGGFAIELEDKTKYTVEPEKKGEDDSTRIEVVPTFFGFKIPNIDGMPITVKRAILGKKSVSFGGALDFGAFLTSMCSLVAKKSEPKPTPLPTGIDIGNKKTENKDSEDGGSEDIACALNVDEIRFTVSDQDSNVLVLQGINAGGKIGIPSSITEKLIPTVKLGAYFEVKYNTFDHDEFYMAGGFDLFVVQADAVISMKRVDVGKVPVWIPDKVVVSGGSNEPGIPLVPPTVVAYLTKLGGGFENLYDTVTGNFTILPPLTLKAIAGINLAKIFSADKITLSASVRGMSISAEDMKIVKLNFLKEVSLGIAFADAIDKFKFDITGTAKVDIFGVIVGDGSLFFGVDTSRKGNLGPVKLGGSINGRIQIPTSVPFIGGLSLGSASAGISDENVYATIRPLGIPLGIKYSWGASAPIITFASKNAGQAVNCSMTNLSYVSNYKPDGSLDGTFVYGDNVKIRSKSVYNLLTEGKTKLRLLSNGTRYDYPFSFAKGQKYGMVGASYEGAVPELKLISPDGQEVPLEEGKNYMLQTIDAKDSKSGLLEKRFLISFVDPQQGTWSLSADKQFDFTVMDVTPIPQLDTVKAEMVNNQLKAAWTGEDMGDASMSFFLCKNTSDNAGTLIAQGIPSSKNEITLKIPDKINTGDYYLRVQLEDSEKTYSSLYASEKLYITDPNQPAVPGNLNVKLAGDGLLDVSWNASSDAEGYYLEVFDSDNKSQGIIEVKDGSTEKVIGGKYTDINGNDGGLIPGKPYKVALTAYKTVNEQIHMSPSIQSQLISVPVPAPASISISPSAIAGQLQLKTDEKGNSYYLTNEDSININFSSNQSVKSVLTVNGNEIVKPSGTLWQEKCDLNEGDNFIYTFAYNSAGDTSKTGIKIVRDTTPPELKMDCPKSGALIEGSKILVRGTAEFGSTVKVNGIPVDKNENNVFETSVDLGQEITQTISVVAEDQAKNRTESKITVFNNNVKDIQKVVIKGNQGIMETNSLQNLTLWAVDKQGNEVKLDNDAVKWDILEGSGSASVSTEGTLKSYAGGKVVVKASVPVTEDYSFEDATVVKVINKTGSEIENLELNPSDVRLKVGEEIQLGASAVFTGLESAEISNDAVQWEVVANDSCVEVNSKGLVKAVKAGASIVKATYTVGGKSYEAHALITVTGNIEQPDNNRNINNTLTDTDKSILEILSSIIKNDSDLNLLLTAYLSNENETDLSAGKLNLKFPPMGGSEQRGIAIGKVINPSKWNKTNMQLFSDIYDIRLTGDSPLPRPGSLEITYDPNKAANVNDLTVCIYNAASGQWESSDGTVDPVKNSISVQIRSSGKYVILSKSELIKIQGTDTVPGGLAIELADIGGRWSEKDIKQLVSRNIVNGIKLNDKYYFYPEKTITREEFVKMVVLAEKMEISNTDVSQIFADYEKISSWAIPYISTAYDKKVISGYPSGNKKVIMAKNPITRAEAAVIIGKLLPPSQNVPMQTNFKDAQSIPSWAQPFMGILVQNKIISGFPDNTFGPSKLITREEAAAMISRFIQNQGI